MTNADWWERVRNARDVVANAPLTERLGFVSAPWHLWTRVKDGHSATADARPIHNIGLEVRFSWDGDFRASQVHRDPNALSEHAEAERQELLERGWQTK